MVEILHSSFLIWCPMDHKNRENEILIGMDEPCGPSFEMLAEAWWAISEALQLNENPWKQQWHNRIFCDLLKQCSWTVEAWNDENEWRKFVKEETDPALEGGTPPGK